MFRIYILLILKKKKKISALFLITPSPNPLGNQSK